MDICNKYETQKIIGKGAQGTVYLAKDQRLGREVAIKSLHKEFISNETHFRRFEEEAKILSQLNHNSIVTLYDYCYDHDGFYLVMELVKGDSLDEIIKKDGFIVQIRAINIFIRILKAIQYIHDNKIIHRDIKPSNIILDENDKIKLLDFGIANKTDRDIRLTIVGSNAGFSPMYATPEHITNSKITNQSDIYSLGVTLWQMVTGIAPYEGLPATQIYGKIERDPLPDIQDVIGEVNTSTRMNAIIQKATSKKPSDRYNSCKGFIRDVENLKERLLQAEIKINNTLIGIVDDAIPDPDILKYVDVTVKNVDNTSIIINDKGIVGTELTYSNMPGEKVRITITKEGYRKYVQQFTLNDHRKIPVNLVKKNKSIIPIILSSVILLVTVLLILKNIL